MKSSASAFFIRISFRHTLSYSLLLIMIAYLGACHVQSKQPRTQKGLDKSAEPSARVIAGTDLLASGETPVMWRIEMDFEKEFRFVTANGDSLVTTAVSPFVDESEKKDIYKVNCTTGPMVIDIFHKNCSSGGMQAEVRVNRITYKGCASYMENRSLAGNWELEMIDDKPVTDYTPTAPYPNLQIDNSLTKMNGFDGCNTISSSVRAEGDRIRFGPILSTKKFCAHHEAGDMIIRWVSDKLVRYTVSPDILTLYLGNDGRMVFRKK